MTLTINPLFNSIRSQSLDLHHQKKGLQTLEKEIKLAKEINSKAYQEMQDNNHILNWENHPNKELLDRLYALDYFEGKEKAYRFETPEQIMAFQQNLQTYLSESMDTQQLSKNRVQEAQNELMHFQQEILSIIRQLGECMATVNRRM